MHLPAHLPDLADREACGEGGVVVLLPLGFPAELARLHLGPLGIPLDAPPPPELDLLVPPVQQLREGAGRVHYARAGGGWIGLLLCQVRRAIFSKTV